MDCDVLVVGAGPAGLSAAFFLSSQSRLDVVVADRLEGEAYRRYHRTCGAGISRAAFREIRPLEPDPVLNEISSLDIVWPDGTEIRLGTEGYILDRPAFLTGIRGRAVESGASFVSGRVAGITRNGRGYTARMSSGEEIVCRYVIGADGANSVVRKDLFGTSAAEVVPATEYIVDRDPPDGFVFRVGERYRGGYMWEFPCGSMTCTGATSGSHQETGYVFKGGRMIPIGGVGRIVEGNALLAGDSAGMANPVSFGGLRTALVSGRRAAEAVIGGDPRRYERWWACSPLSSPRFMNFHRRMASWTDEEMNRAVKPFSRGYVYLSGAWASLTRPRYIDMYWGCLFSFRYSW
jgi:digeranylgeranylglycerophospholipid reductase